jgi:hypothetical protein
MMASLPGDLLPFARGELLRQIEGAEERVWLTSPFLSAPIAEYLVEAADRSRADDRRLLTALVRSSVIGGALDPRALRVLGEGGFEVRSRRNLHAKVSIVDFRWGLVGSGNLTNAGLGSTGRGNAELGVVLTEDQVEVAAKIVEDWWKGAKEVTAEMIDRFDALERISTSWGDEGEGPPVETGQVGRLEAILAEGQEAAWGRSYWLKSAYHDPSQPDWWHRGWISDSAPLPRYEKDDLIVIYLGAKNDGPQLCTAVVSAEKPPRHDRRWVLDHRDVAAADQWPYVTETAFIADLPVGQGVSLSTIGRTGHSLRRGNCGISRMEFELLARAMVAAR